jgi:hypothetical protein
MIVDRLRIRFEDSGIAQDRAEAIARRVRDLVAGGAGVDDDPNDALARRVASSIERALRGAGQ